MINDSNIQDQEQAIGFVTKNKLVTFKEVV